MNTHETVIGSDLFSASAQRIVDYLSAHTPLTDWSVSRVSGGEQVHVHVHPESFLTTGQRVPWDETFCIRMYHGASRIVPDSHLDPDYADNPDAQVVRAYAGFPITDDDGELFGTLCGVANQPLVDESAIDADLLALMGELLSSHLAMSRIADRERRSVEIAGALASEDALTGLVNRRGWDLLVTDAQQRVDAYGDLVAVAVLDLDGLKQINDTEGHQAGDELIRRAASALRAAARPADRVARYGGDEFAILSNNVPVPDLPGHFARFTDALAEHGVSASMGFAQTNPGLVTMQEAFSRADKAMYDQKQSRRN
ncbi:MAG: sensor domain-containing diguanylate cyclase [Aeromicrobium sp.]